MTIHETVSTVDILQMHEEDMFEGIMFICRQMWQHASRYRRSKYMQYAMSPLEFSDYVKEFTAENDQDFIDDVLNVLSNLGDIEDLAYEDGTYDEKQAGHILQIISYIGCILGAEACEGDLELFVYKFQRLIRWPSRIISPCGMLEFRRRGDSSPLQEFLTDQLALSIKKLKKLRRNSKDQVFLGHGPSPWRFHPKQGLIGDGKLLSTYYHLYYSLLRYIEMPAGEA